MIFLPQVQVLPNISEHPLFITTGSVGVNDTDKVIYNKDGTTFIQEADGTLTLRPKPPIQIFGETILRPLIERSVYYSSHLFNAVWNGMSSLDARISKLFPIFPSVAASSNQVIIINQGHNQLVNPSGSKIDFESYREKLSTADKAKLNNDNQFTALYDEAQTIKDNLFKFIDSMSNNYRKYGEMIYEYSKSYDKLFQKIDEITLEVQNKGPNSDYSSVKPVNLILIFPRYFINTVAPGASPSITVRSGSLLLDDKELLSGVDGIDNSKEETMNQAMHQISNQITDRIFSGAGFNLDLFTIDENTDVNTYKSLFTKDSIEKMSKHLEKKKGEITNWLGNEQGFLRQLFENKNLVEGGLIRERIESIFKLHKGEIEESNKRNKTRYVINSEKENGLISEWQTTLKCDGLFCYDTQLFHFYIRTDAPLTKPKVEL